MATTTITSDIPANLSTTADLAVGDTIITDVNFAGDFDWIRVSLEAGVTYRFTMTADNGTNIDASIIVRNAAGTIVRNDDNGTGLVNEFEFTVPPGAALQDFYLDVGDFNSSATGRYSLTVVEKPPFGFNDIPDDNSSIETLTTAATVSSNIGGAGDRDWFAVDLVAGTTYTFEMTQNGVSNLTSHLMLRKAGGKILADDWDSGRGGSQLTFTATQTGTFFLDAGALSNTDGNYNLTMYEGSPFGANDIAGDKNTTATLQHGDIVKSKIAPIDLDDDEDWFKVELKAGETYTFTMEATAGSALDGYLGIFRPNGDLVASINNGQHPDDPRGWIGPGDGSGDVELTYTATKTGTYYLAATTAITSTNLAGHSDGAYRVSMLQAGKGTDRDDILIGTDENDVLDGLAGNDLIRGRGGNDFLVGGPGDDRLFGNAGNDVLNYTRGDDLLDGGAGFDRFYCTRSRSDNKGFEIDLRLKGWQEMPHGRVKLVSIEDVYGSFWRDVLKGSNADERLFGSSGNDLLIGRGGSDDLRGGDDKDTLQGDGGRDKIDGGYGNDQLTGGKGGDTFIFQPDATRRPAKFGHDTITDFDVGNLDEKMDFSKIYNARKSDFDITLAANAKGTTHIEYKPTGATIDLEKAYFASKADFWDQVIL
ncbi:MAG: pre-peptidase C-terminal domain-containing protein [Hyphomicrobiaceae bacterium]|nr:pre-peptidase C-terminal domain-containing protein [Hyphomicrobiaceae bacterium]MCC0024812.1 pre-peptidase C-terminal domain-containing protein [Hyphomicrobiaceae bacterium]